MLRDAVLFLCASLWFLRLLGEALHAQRETLERWTETEAPVAYSAGGLGVVQLIGSAVVI